MPRHLFISKNYHPCHIMEGFSPLAVHCSNLVCTNMFSNNRKDKNVTDFFDKGIIENIKRMERRVGTERENPSGVL